MSKTPKKDTGFTGIGTNNELAIANLAVNAVPGMAGNSASLALDLVTSDIELHRNIQAASEMMGESALALKAGSPAFKNYVKKELPEIYGDRAIGFGFSLAGGAAAMAVAGMIFGLPGGIPGMVIGLAIGAVGTFIAGMLKDTILPSTYNGFLNFASDLQGMGQQRQMSPEAAFVALTMNMDERTKKSIISSLPGSARVRTDKDMIKLLATDQGREILRRAALEHDSTIRAGIGAMSAMPTATISEHFSQLVNNGQLAGVDLLNLDKTGHVGVLIAMHETQRMQQQLPPQQPQQQLAPHNHNTHLPSHKNNQLGM